MAELPTIHGDPFDRIQIAQARLEGLTMETGGRRAEGVPLFDGGLTGPEGVSGSLGALGSGSVIGVTELGAEPTTRYLDARRARQHDAIVAVTPTGPGVALMNAVHFFEPFGPPVLQVGSEACPHLAEQARRGSSARVVVSASRQAAETCNVAATIPGRDPSLAPVVVMTPRSGWWHCAGERGGGIACWLEVMRSMAGSGPARGVLFVSTTGHEIGLPGIEAFLGARAAGHCLRGGAGGHRGRTAARAQHARGGGRSPAARGHARLHPRQEHIVPAPCPRLRAVGARSGADAALHHQSAPSRSFLPDLPTGGGVPVHEVAVVGNHYHGALSARRALNGGEGQ